MTVIDILQELLALQNTFRGMLDQEPLLTRALHTTRSYDFIRVEWKDSEYTAFCVLELVCDSRTAKADLKLLYCEDKTLEELIRKQVPSSFSLVKAERPFSGAIIKNLVTADRIAALTVNCATGDSYRPGNFSSVQLADDYILLSQVNHMNAKSLAHKEDYSLRDLEFLIPLTATPDIKFYHDYQSGGMRIRFDDRSSQNNKVCGDRVMEELEKLKGEM